MVSLLSKEFWRRMFSPVEKADAKAQKLGIIIDFR